MVAGTGLENGKRCFLQSVSHVVERVLAQQIHPNPLITSTRTPLGAGDPIHGSGSIFIWQHRRGSKHWLVQSHILALSAQHRKAKA
jgi:hypothetical protein